MKHNLSALHLVVAALVILLISQSAYTVDQVKQALVVQLGKPKDAIIEPGLHFKIPFIEKVHMFDRRLLMFDQDPQEVLSKDKKNLKVDNYARWKIVNPLIFYRTVGDERGAISRLNDIIYSNLREVLGQYTMMEIVAGERDNLMEQIRNQANKQAGRYGIRVVDVRIKRADLPEENSKAVFRRMQTERERQAKEYRAQGAEEAVKIRSRADKERTVLLADAYRKAQQIRGEGDASAARIYADSYEKDPDFYHFTRSLEAYRSTFQKQTTLVLDPETDFFRYLKGMHLDTSKKVVVNQKPAITEEVVPVDDVKVQEPIDPQTVAIESAAPAEKKQEAAAEKKDGKEDAALAEALAVEVEKAVRVPVIDKE
ncbi:protease modulator HflC [Magnetococcales bacterium HHB-1]